MRRILLYEEFEFSDRLGPNHVSYYFDTIVKERDIGVGVKIMTKIVINYGDTKRWITT